MATVQPEEQNEWEIEFQLDSIVNQTQRPSQFQGSILVQPEEENDWETEFQLDPVVNQTQGSTSGSTSIRPSQCQGSVSVQREEQNEWEAEIQLDPVVNKTQGPTQRQGSTSIRPTQRQGSTSIRPSQCQGSTLIRPSQHQGSTSIRPSQWQGSTSIRPSQCQGSTSIRPSQHQGSTSIQPTQPQGSTSIRPSQCQGSTSIRPSQCQGSISIRPSQCQGSTSIRPSQHQGSTSIQPTQPQGSTLIRPSFSPVVNEIIETPNYQNYGENFEIMEIMEIEAPKKPKKKSTSPSDFFQEIDLCLGLLGESINETEGKFKVVKFHDNIFKLFVKPKRKRTIGQDKKFIRLRDWVTTSEGLLVNETQWWMHRREHSIGDETKRKWDTALLAGKMKLLQMIGLEKMKPTHGKRHFKDIYQKSSQKEIGIAADHGSLKKPTLERVIPPKNNPIVIDLTQDDEPGPSTVIVHATPRMTFKKENETDFN